MNNLKFRAWHKLYKEYYHVVSIKLDDKIVTIYNGSDIGSYHFDEVIIEQYARLKDINGKEIYINDILKVTLENTREIFICLSDYKEFILNSIFSAYHKLEVIGNIHENKEMLK